MEPVRNGNCRARPKDSAELFGRLSSAVLETFSLTDCRDDRHTLETSSVAL